MTGRGATAQHQSRESVTPSQARGRATVHALPPPVDPDPFPGEFAVPGSVGMRYTPGVGMWKERRRVLDWCPVVTRHIVDRTGRGSITRREVTIEVAGHVDTVAVRDLGDAKACVWDRFPAAAGEAGREVHDALRNLVKDQTSRLPLIDKKPRWENGRLVLPPIDVLPRGYGLTAGTEDDFRAFLRVTAGTTRAALACGFACGGLYVKPLGRQTAVIHIAGPGRKGKSTAEFAAAAVLGYPAESPEAPGDGVIVPWNTTGQGPGVWLGSLSILPGFRDEFSAAGYTADQSGKLIFQITQGGERDMSTRTGEYREAQSSYHGYLISTGNYSLLDQLSGRDGIPSRVVEIAAPVTDSPEEAHRIEAAAQAGYGHGLVAIAGRGPNPDVFRGLAEQAAKDLGVAAGGIERSIGRHLAMAVAGARVLAELFEVPELAQAALTAGRIVYAELLTGLAERGADPGERLIAAVAGAMATDPGMFPTRAAHETACAEARKWGRALPRLWAWDTTSDDGVGGDVAIIKTALRNITDPAGIEDGRIALKELKRAGRLTARADELIHLVWVTPPDGGPKRGVPCYVIKGVHPAETGALTGQERVSQDLLTGSLTGSLTGADQGSNGSNGFSDTQVYTREEDVPEEVALPLPQAGPCGAGCGFDASDTWYDGQPWHTGCLDAHLLNLAATQVSAPVTVPPAKSAVAKKPSSHGVPADELARAGRVIRDPEGGWPDASDADIASAYSLFQQVTAVPTLDTLAGGVRMIGDPGYVGTKWVQCLRDGYSGSVTTGALDSELVEAVSTGGNLLRYLDHIRADADPASMTGLAILDVRGAYNASALNTELGHGAPSHYTTARSVRAVTSQPKWSKAPGYVLLAKTPRFTVPVPAALAELTAGSWLANPLADLLLNPWPNHGPLIKGELAVAELVYWHRGDYGRRLNRFAEAARDAAYALEALDTVPARYAAHLVKRVRNALLGGYLRSGKYNRNPELIRLDWSDMVVSQTSANVARKTLRATVERQAPEPVGIYRDDIWYADASPAALAHEIVPGKIGKLKVKGVVPMTDPLATAIKDRSPYNVSTVLAAALRGER